MTLGEMVDDILNDLDSDEVTLYDDTVESRQVAQIIKICYFNIVDSREWPHFLKTFTITETSAATPTHMTLVNTVKSLKYLKYNKRLTAGTYDDYQLVKFLEPQRFMSILDSRTTGATITQITDASNIKYKVLNNVAPTYYTTFDEQTLVFDSYDVGVDTFLKTIKTQGYGMVYPTVTLSDGFYFDLPTNMFSLLLAESKSTAFRVLKQTTNPVAEFFVQTQRAKFQLDEWKIRKNFKIKDFNIQMNQTQQVQGQENV